MSALISTPACRCHVHPHAEVAAIEDDTVALADVHTGEISYLSDIAGVVLIVGNAAADGLARELADADMDIHVFGDAQAPWHVFNAIWEAESAARKL